MICSILFSIISVKMKKYLVETEVHEKKNAPTKTISTHFVVFLFFLYLVSKMGFQYTAVKAEKIVLLEFCAFTISN